MTTLWWPGDHRAGDLMSDTAVLDALVRVECAWSSSLVAADVAPAEAEVETSSLAFDLDRLARDAEAGGNAVIPLVAAMRAQLPEEAARWLHRGMTSQDVLDTAIVLVARDAVRRIREEVDHQVDVLVALCEEHRDTPMAARTLTQPAVPTTFGARVAAWLRGVLDARDDLAALRFPVQLGGAAGTLAALVELGGPERAHGIVADLARRLELEPALPWHTERAPVTRIADAAVRASSAWSRIANDVLVMGRAEVAELAEGAAGGSSTMPGKANPTLSVLVRRHALSAPQLGATLHLAAADQSEERADGAWHVEWHSLALLLRRSVVAASQTTTLVADLVVDAARMRQLAEQLDGTLRAEQRTMAALAGHEPAPDYLGLVPDLVDQTLTRARGVQNVGDYRPSGIAPHQSADAGTRR